MDDNQDNNPLKRYERQMCLDIYKLQVEMLNESSNRRVNVNRYYMYAMSFLVLALSAFIANKSGIFNIGAATSSTNEVSSLFISFALCGISLLGAAITESWIQNASGYLRSNSNREEIIRSLEVELPYSFHERMYGLEDNTDYIQLAHHELYAPLIFRTGFLIVVFIGTSYLRDMFGYLFYAVIAALGILLLQSFYTKFQILPMRSEDNEK